MARPQTKTDLLEQAQTNYEKLAELIESFSAEEQLATFPFEDRDRNIRDVLAHLYEWQLMMAKWYTIGMNGDKPVMPAEGYTWKTTGPMNLEIWKKYQEIPLEETESLLQLSHQKMLDLINQHTNEELFTKKVYPWTNTTSLGAYFVSATSSHYDWALKKIRKYKRGLTKS